VGRVTFTNRFRRNLDKQLAAGKDPDAAVRAAARASGARLVPQAAARDDSWRRHQQIVGYLMHERGRSYAAIGRGYGISATTAKEWVRAGQHAWEADPAGCRAELVARFDEAFVDTLLGEGR
jgi:hypothetical protein